MNYDDLSPREIQSSPVRSSHEHRINKKSDKTRGNGMTRETNSLSFHSILTHKLLQRIVLYLCLSCNEGVSLPAVYHPLVSHFFIIQTRLDLVTQEKREKRREKIE